MKDETRSMVGIPFSKLPQRPEKTRCLRERKAALSELDFWRWGTLANGRSFGVLRSAVAMDPGYYEFQAALLDADGVCRRWALLGEHYDQCLPEAMVALSGGDRLLWLLRGKLYCWDGLAGRPAVCVNDRLPEETVISDAILRESGLLELVCSGGLRFGYVSGADAVLEPLGEGWLAHAGEESCTGWNTALQDCMTEEPLPWGLALEEGVAAVEWLSFSEVGLRELRLPESLKRIGPEAFSDNPALEQVTIPKDVRYVEESAFRGCTGLRELRIEASPSRLPHWDETAFAGCPCEADFLRQRRAQEQWQE